MTKSINIESIEKATKKSWSSWVDELDKIGAREMSHTDLARMLYDQLDGKIESHGWWAQGITVAYEQHIGKRVPGQLANGLFEFSVSKTTDIPRNELFAHVCEWFNNLHQVNAAVIIKPRTSETPRRSNWRCNFENGSKFSVTVEIAGKKTKLVLSHTALPNEESADDWKQYWKMVADKLVFLPQ